MEAVSIPAVVPDLYVTTTTTTYRAHVETVSIAMRVDRPMVSESYCITAMRADPNPVRMPARHLPVLSVEESQYRVLLKLTTNLELSFIID